MHLQINELLESLYTQLENSEGSDVAEMCASGFRLPTPKIHNSFHALYFMQKVT
jgi:hypothetical protein